MGDPRPYGPGENGPDAAIPRDLPDQQAGPGPDPLDVPTGDPKDDQRDGDTSDADATSDDAPGSDRSGAEQSGSEQPGTEQSDTEQSDTEQSDTGRRRDAASQGGINPEQPPPEEPAD